MAVIAEIIERHAEDAAFLWMQRDSAVNAPHYSLDDLAALDARVEAHLDGLRVGGAEAREISAKLLTGADAGEMFTLAFLAVSYRDFESLAALVERCESSWELTRGIVSALAWGNATATPLAEPVMRLVALATSAVKRRDAGADLARALAANDGRLRARALRAVGELGRIDLLPHLIEHCRSSVELDAFESAWSGTLLNDIRARDRLIDFLDARSAFAVPAANLVMRRLPLEDARALHAELSRSAQLRLAVIAAGYIGDSELVPWIIECMGDPDLARVAGEAFGSITGADIALNDLEGERPANFEGGPTENAEDENVALDADENLAWPSAPAVKRWWDEHRGHLPTPGPLFLGRLKRAGHLEGALRSGRQRDRAAAAIELAIANPGRPLFEWRAPGFEQQAALGG